MHDERTERPPQDQAGRNDIRSAPGESTESRVTPQGTAPSGSRLPSRSTVAAAGFTLIGLLAVMAIIGVLTAIATPYFTCQIQKSKMASAMADLNYGADLVEMFEVEHGRFPTTLDEAYSRQEPPDTLIYCIDDEDGNSGHGNEACAFFDAMNSSGQNQHGGMPQLGFMLRTIADIAPCQDFSFAWTKCCGGSPTEVAPDEEANVPGHPGNPQRDK